MKLSLLVWPGAPIQPLRQGSSATAPVFGDEDSMKRHRNRLVEPDTGNRSILDVFRVENRHVTTL